MGWTRLFALLVWMLSSCNTFDDPSDGGSSGFFGDDVPNSPPQSLPPVSDPGPSFVDPPPSAGRGGASGGWMKVDGGQVDGPIDAADGGADDAGE